MQQTLYSLRESEIIQQQKQFKVLLIGESCQDIYHYGVCDRLCAEAPVPVFDYRAQEIKPGMAANVRENLLAFGLKVDFVTNPEDQLIKRRFIDTKSNHLLLREDVGHQVDSVDIPSCIGYDAIVISDYNKGLLNVSQIKDLCKNFGGPIFVDSKNPRLKHFSNAIIKINNTEEKKMETHPQNSELIVTMGKMGAKWKDMVFPTPQVDVFDVTGAGDVFLSSLSYFYLSTQDMKKSISNAVYLASKSVQHMGVYVLTQDDIREVMK
jgi:D-beta-D-heptose 7-phosphate kinase/D-beta-D-heptose 1-phosphate adenosyltransferase